MLLLRKQSEQTAERGYTEIQTTEELVQTLNLLQFAVIQLCGLELWRKVSFLVGDKKKGGDLDHNS